MKYNSIKIIFFIIGLFFIFNLSGEINSGKLILNTNCNKNVLNNNEKITYSLDIPKNIDIKIDRLQKWYRNILTIITQKNDLSNRIPYDLKTFYKTSASAAWRMGYARNELVFCNPPRRNYP